MTYPRLVTIFILVLVKLSTTSCSSSKPRATSKDFKETYKNALSKVEKSEDDKRNLKKLAIALSDLLIFYDDRIQMLDTHTLSDLLEATELTKSMKENVEQSLPFTGDRYVMFKDSLSFRIADYQRSIAKIYAARGRRRYQIAKRDNSKLEYRDAFLNFEKALTYDKSIIEISPYMDTCLAKAVVNIHVQAAPSVDLLETYEINRDFRCVTEQSNRFRNVYYRNLSQKSNADCKIALDFVDLGFEHSTYRNTTIITDTIITGFKTVTNQHGISVQDTIYEIVNGEVELILETKRGNWRANVTVEGSGKNCGYLGSSYAVGAETQIVSYKLSGDQRAISDYHKNHKVGEFKKESVLIAQMRAKILNEFLLDYF